MLRPSLSQLCILLAVLPLGACESASPPATGPLHVAGRVLIEGHPPGPPIFVSATAFTGSAGPDSLVASQMFADTLGTYELLLPVPDIAVADSLILAVRDVYCNGEATTLLRRYRVPLHSGPVTFPVIDIPLLKATQGPQDGAAVCAPFTTGPGIQLHLEVDQGRNALDTTGFYQDKAVGRWTLIFAPGPPSTGTYTGTFADSSTAEEFALHLRPDSTTPCPVMTLVFRPYRHDFDIATLSGSTAPQCPVPAIRMRFTTF